MIYGLRVLERADADIDEAADYIAKNSKERSLQFYDAVGTSFEELVRNPTRWAFYGFTTLKSRDIRKMFVVQFSKYLIFYRIDADMVEVVRVLHGARDITTIFEAMVNE